MGGCCLFVFVWLQSMDEIDSILNAPLSNDPNALRAEIQKARQAETKAKTQIYTLRGKKGLQAMAAAMGEELPPQLAETPIYDDPEDSPQIQELRRQIALIREMERQQHEQIAELRRKKVELESGSNSMVEMPRVASATVTDNNIAVQQASASGISLQKPAEPASNAVPAYANFEKQPSAAAAPAPATRGPPPAAAPSGGSHVAAFNQSSTIVSAAPVSSSPAPSAMKSPRKKGKNGKVQMQAPDSLMTKVLNASWDSGAVKSKKSNKVYTIQVTMNAVTWKIIRGDDMLVELAKRLSKSKAEGTSLPPLVKKVVKRDQQGELATSVENYLNQIQTSIVFGPKKDKTKAAFLKFFAPFSSRDEGMGNFPGGTGDPESWFIWKLGLGD